MKEETQQLIHELNGKKYLLVEIPVTQKQSSLLESKLKKFNCIYQGVKEINRGGLFSNPFMVIKVLVPEENVQAFNDED